MVNVGKLYNKVFVPGRETIWSRSSRVHDQRASNTVGVLLVVCGELATVFGINKNTAYSLEKGERWVNVTTMNKTYESWRKYEHSSENKHCVRRLTGTKWNRRNLRFQSYAAVRAVKAMTESYVHTHK